MTTVPSNWPSCTANCNNNHILQTSVAIMKFFFKLFRSDKNESFPPQLGRSLSDFAESASRRHSERRETLSQIVSDEDTIFPDQFK